MSGGISDDSSVLTAVPGSFVLGVSSDIIVNDPTGTIDLSLFTDVEITYQAADGSEAQWSLAEDPILLPVASQAPISTIVLKVLPALPSTTSVFDLVKRMRKGDDFKPQPFPGSGTLMGKLNQGGSLPPVPPTPDDSQTLTFTIGSPSIFLGFEL